MIEIDQKKQPCPQFAEVILLRHLPHSISSLLGRGSRGRWLFYLGQEWIGEPEIEKIVADLKHLRKIQGKVLIVLDGIDQNAKLIAQEAKLQLWDLRILNGLLDLYDLPKIILPSPQGFHESHEIEKSYVGSVAQDVPALELR